VTDDFCFCVMRNTIRSRKNGRVKEFPEIKLFMYDFRVALWEFILHPKVLCFL